MQKNLLDFVSRYIPKVLICTTLCLTPAAYDIPEAKNKVVHINTFGIYLETKSKRFFCIYFFSLAAKADAVAPPLNTGSEIEIGSGLVFSIYGNNGNNTKK
jgi:hypothetical protein